MSDCDADTIGSTLDVVLYFNCSSETNISLSLPPPSFSLDCYVLEVSLIYWAQLDVFCSQNGVQILEDLLLTLLEMKMRRLLVCVFVCVFEALTSSL